LAAALVALFLRGLDWVKLGEAFRQAKLGYLGGLVVATVLCYVVRSWRWHYLLRPIERVPFPRLLSATYIGFMSGLLVPRAGEVLRPYLVSRRYPAVSISAGFATIILERLVDLITVLILFALYLYVLPTPSAQTPGPLLSWHGFTISLSEAVKVFGALAALGVIAVLVVLFLFHVYAERALTWADRLFSRLPARLARPLIHLLRSFGEGLAVLKAPPRLLAVIFAQSFLVWLLIAIGFHLNNLAFGIVLPLHASFLLIVFLTVGVAIPTPGAVGGFHYLYKVAMSGMFGVDANAAVAAALSAHALTNLPVLVLGLVFLAREGLTMGQVAELAGKGDDREKGSPPKP